MPKDAKRLGEEPAYARPASLDNSGSSHQDGDRHVDETEGLTKREVFAMAALQGELAAQASGDGDPYGTWTPEGAATRAVNMADALLAELAKGA